MKSLHSIQLFLTASSFATSSYPSIVTNNTKPFAPVLTRVVYQFPIPTWLENIATMRNGSLLTGKFGDTASLYLIDPATNTASLVHDFSSSSTNTVFGISELAPDVWTVLTGHYLSATGATPGSSILWKVDFTDSQTSGEAQVEKILELKETNMPNGLAVVNEKTILFADSFAGKIGRVLLAGADGNGTANATYDVALTSPNMEANSTAPLPLGADGLKYHAPYLYWSQTWSGRIVRAEISGSTGLRVGDDEVLATDLGIIDDLELSPDGKTLYVVKPYAKELVRIELPKAKGEKAGPPEVVLGGEGSTVVPGGTAVSFGRRESDGDVLYVSTLGGYTGDFGDGTNYEGGKVLAVYLGGVTGCA